MRFTYVGTCQYRIACVNIASQSVTPTTLPSVTSSSQTRDCGFVVMEQQATERGINTTPATVSLAEAIAGPCPTRKTSAARSASSPSSKPAPSSAYELSTASPAIGFTTPLSPSKPHTNRFATRPSLSSSPVPSPTSTPPTPSTCNGHASGQAPARSIALTEPGEIVPTRASESLLESIAEFRMTR
jgi:hypothetical protein